MNVDFEDSQNRLAETVRIGHPLSLAALASLLSGAAMLLSFTLGSTAFAGDAKANSKPADVVYVDSGNPIDGGGLFKVDGATGQQVLLSSGGFLRRPFGVVAGQDGTIFVSDNGSAAIVAVSPRTGVQTLVSSGNVLGVPYGIAIDRDGNILAANAQNLVRINPSTGLQSVVATGGFLVAPIGVAVGANDEIYVLDALGAVIHVNPRSNVQTVISRAGMFNNPQGIAIHGSTIYVTDVATPDGNFGMGRITTVNAHTGAHSMLTEGSNLVCPVGIAVADDGRVIVGDPYTINQSSPDLFDGGIVGVDHVNGTQNLLARGHGGFVNPRGVAVLKTALSQ